MVIIGMPSDLSMSDCNEYFYVQEFFAFNSCVFMLVNEQFIMWDWVSVNTDNVMHCLLDIAVSCDLIVLGISRH